MPKYKKNPELKLVLEESDGEEENPDCGLEDLMNLLEQDNEENNDEDAERKKIFIRKEKPAAASQIAVNEEELCKTPTQATPNTESRLKSSITITRIPREKASPAVASTTPSASNAASNQDETILTEKHTGIRLIKSSFKNEIDLNMRLACDHGKFLKLTDINRRAHELKEAKDFKWFSIFLLHSKTESKCSANGNNYGKQKIFFTVKET